MDGKLSSSIQLCHSCTPDITKGTRQYYNAVLPVAAPKFADASAGTGTQGTRQEAATDIHKTLFYPGTFVREDKLSIRNQTFMDQF